MAINWLCLNDSNYAIGYEGCLSGLKGAQQPPIFGPCLLWKTAGWIKMPLGREVGLGPGNSVLDWVPANPPKGHNSAIFRSSPGNELVDWNSGVSIRPYVHKFFFQF